MRRSRWPHVVMISAAMAVAVSSATLVAAPGPKVDVPADLRVNRLFVKKPKAEIAGSTRRIIALAEPGQTIHQPFADAALRWLQETAPKEAYDRSPRPDVHVLANVDESSYEPARAVKMGDHPVIWTNPHYKARNVYFQFGHKAELFQNSAFKTLFLNAIRWASER